jgi:DNA-binding PadR family transcriptional regulator
MRMAMAGGMRGQMRLGRMFEQGDVRNVILRLLAEKPRHGYDVIRAIEALFGGLYAPSPGVIYPTLTMLEDQGYARVETAEGGKKLYTLTPEGLAHLEANAAPIDAVFARIAGVVEEASGGSAGELQRAMRNVARSVFFRDGKVAWTAEQIAQVVALLDRTAGEIEQI